MNNIAKSFNILAINLNILHNYFNTKQNYFSDKFSEYMILREPNRWLNKECFPFGKTSQYKYRFIFVIY